MRRFQFGYVRNGSFYRKTVEAKDLDEAIEIFFSKTPGAEVVSSVEV